MKRRRTLSSESSFDVDEFKNHTSTFGDYEESALRIKIIERDTHDFLFYPTCSSTGEEALSIPGYLQQLVLGDFDYNKILTFKASEHEELSDVQCLFLTKLKYVLMNNKDNSSSGRFEPFIQDLVNYLLRECKLEDGRNLYMVPSSLRLYVKDKDFLAHIDREGRRGEKIVWILGENKHHFDPRYRQGDIQLVASIIAAAQRNYTKLLGVIEPKSMYGIKVVGDKFFFYKVELDEEYIANLSTNLPDHDFVVERYPKRAGLTLSHPQERTAILHLLFRLREYALSLDDRFTLLKQ
ncbi:hypothetical protein DM01DRAFT_1340654 [Hesseltinella vesiculosa]|uniref:Uncharacterized protein n=1 Tax=Hesseltinella vesiculosa TaxID=101127 RepID=A0A1X2G3D5_9FUNG|nr:hypothetical protein DM01DRAFT_1340654 [Hesseltinella vesiculosa]